MFAIPSSTAMTRFVTTCQIPNWGYRSHNAFVAEARASLAGLRRA